ncbi:hypothetical protein F441_05434 [Phytophthora nicotianae CJ01A1]|uniref:Uncharacterized protein n=3 Tax=Phytophthora nicotianae TaxID=4792 RepID=W2QFJ5_PHYN3|nr:hypothetical protein PPTG_22556 [Phytophthora nicotianae INRA-310]ETL44518.1 hypothetical protein L916_05239 [Phytophthora nicotianae]ETN11937.1 hypothetical protein PPTG_22556 [Phytophthora nicotianae INRA-310]ETP20991.1 hypothetical protein F441_05434 [Phytophthora nicotianae CJ01A1]
MLAPFTRLATTKFQRCVNEFMVCDQPASTIRRQCQDLRRSTQCAPSWRLAVIAAPVSAGHSSIRAEHAANRHCRLRRSSSFGVWAERAISQANTRKSCPGGQQPSTRYRWMVFGPRSRAFCRTFCAAAPANSSWRVRRPLRRLHPQQQR